VRFPAYEIAIFAHLSFFLVVIVNKMNLTRRYCVVAAVVLGS
jgi:hypothetical protein